MYKYNRMYISFRELGTAATVLACSFGFFICFAMVAAVGLTAYGIYKYYKSSEISQCEKKVQWCLLSFMQHESWFGMISPSLVVYIIIALEICVIPNNPYDVLANRKS